MNRYCCLAVVVLAACKAPTAPSDGGVNVILEPESVSKAALSAIAQVTLTTTGDYPSPYEIPLAVLPQLVRGEVRFRYLPVVNQGALTFHLEAVDASGALVAHADSRVDLTLGQAASTRLMLVGEIDRPNGEPCAEPGQCASGNCVDGVCCDGACGGQCEACNVTPGTCTPTMGAPVGSRAACLGDGSACSGACDGTLRDRCSYPGAAVTCRTASCSSGVETLKAVCGGTGSCPATATSACAPYLCGPTACAPSICSSDADCVTGDYCDPTKQCSVWSPRLLPGLVVWLDPDYGLYRDTLHVVSEWQDHSLALNHALADSPGAGPLVDENQSLNGHPFALFGVGNRRDGLKIADAPSLQWGTGAFTVAVVNRFQNSGSGLVYAKNIVGTPYTGVDCLTGYDSDGWQTAYVIQFQSGDYIHSNDGYNDNKWHIVEYRRDASSLGYVNVDGVNVSTEAVPSLDVSAVGQPVEIGHNPTQAIQQMRGDVAELLAVSGETSNQDLVRLENYLRVKFGLK